MRKPIFMMRFAVLLCFILHLAAQDPAGEIVAGGRIKLFSKVLNEERELFISLPAGYGNSQKRYPVLFVADGSENSLIASGGMIKYFSRWQLPQMIVVFIPNPNRLRDYSLSRQPLERLPGSGGSGGENFLQFLGEELIPHIDSRYRTTDYRIFAGFSATGGYALHILINRPDFFDAYIAASPSIFFEEEFLAQLSAFFKGQRELNKSLYICSYERDIKTTTTVFPKFDQIIRENKPKGFRYGVKWVKGQAHVPSTALFDGLMDLFAEWEPVRLPEITPGGGVLDVGRNMDVTLTGYDQEIHYTLDGSEPTRASPLYTQPVRFGRAVVLKAKSFRGNLAESDVVTAEFKEGKSLVPPAKPTRLEPGLTYRYFERRWFDLPDVIELEPQKTGLTPTFSIVPRDRDDGFLFQFDGFLRIEKTGRYTFHMLSSADCKLFIGNLPILFNEANKASGDPRYDREEASFSLELEKGYHPVRVLYTNAWNQGSDFTVSFEGPGLAKREIQARALFYEPER